MLLSLPTVAQVVVELPLETSLDYRIPPLQRERCAIGQRVLVAVGQRQVLGYIVGLATTSTVADLKDILDILDDLPLLTPDLLRLTRWLAEYYCCPWGRVIKAAVPEGFRVRTEAVYSLTAEAQQHAIPWPAGKATVLLEHLASHGTQKHHELVRAFGASNLRSLLRRLLRHGLITQHLERVAPRTRQRLVRCVRLLLAPAEAQALQHQLQSRAPAQAAILALLQEHPEWEMATLQQRHAGAAAVIKRLQQQSLVEVVQREKLRGVVPVVVPEQPSPPVLTSAQQHALVHIEAQVAAPDGRPTLLHGVTGSGKTEVYMRAIATVLKQGKTALVLVPEIALTEQLVERFIGRFASRVAVLHSGLSGGERFDEWRRLARGEAQIAIGARSAIFAPLQDLGLIIVDEEHDTSYKQEENPRYNARDVAIVRGQQSQAVVVLGSATPALETLHNVQRGKYHSVSLPHRVTHQPLPQITVVDQRLHTTPNERIISTPLYQAIAQCLQRHEQCLILINRRGFAAYLQCRDCGTVPHCMRCSVSLTYHRRESNLKCHYCGFQSPLPPVCPECRGAALRPYGLGTQQVEAALQALFPTARLVRMDRDTTQAKAAHQRILRALGNGDIDILIGTQMIAKGHDYPNITLVGVVSADASLAIPDFRAPERLFQLLTQVAGRAGRGRQPGQVFVQTFRPDHYSIQFAQRHDFRGFFDDEMPRRKEMLYPPYARLGRLLIDSHDAERAQEASQWLGAVLQCSLAEHPDVLILGPAEAPIAKINDRFRWHLLLRSLSSRTLHQCLHAGLAAVRSEPTAFRNVRLHVDIDPVTFL